MFCHKFLCGAEELNKEDSNCSTQLTTSYCTKKNDDDDHVPGRGLRPRFASFLAMSNKSALGNSNSPPSRVQATATAPVTRRIFGMFTGLGFLDGESRN